MARLNRNAARERGGHRPRRIDGTGVGRPPSDFAAECARAHEAQGDYEHDKIAEIEAKVLAGEIPADGVSDSARACPPFNPPLRPNATAAGSLLGSP